MLLAHLTALSQKIIKRLRWGLPPNAESNPDLWKSITTLIQNRASDLRSEWKKTVSPFTMAESSHLMYFQIIESMAKQMHITDLATSLTSSLDDNFRPDGPFLVRVAVIVRLSLLALLDFNLFTYHHSGQFVRGTKARVYGRRSRLNWKTSGTRNNRDSEFIPFLCFINLTWSCRVLAEYYLEDQKKYPRPGAPALEADFTPTPSGSSVIQAAGEALGS